jgi:competence protein ComEC
LILAPNSASYDDLNNYSIVLKLTYNGKSFIFTGDAEVDSEEEILAKGYDLKADVLKVGHHGSTSSTSDEFLAAVSPEYAVICVGVDNTYGHPHQETLDKLNTEGIKIYRTDLSGGTIQFVVDGDQLLVSIEK